MRVKSEAMRGAILAAAAAEFSERGYLGATVNTIATSAGTAPSNVYVYFRSKVEIALAVYEPWFKRRLSALEKVVAKADTPQQKIRRLVKGLLEDIAGDRYGHTSTLIEALASAKPTDEYRPDLLLWAEKKITRVIRDAVPDVTCGDGEVLPAARLLMIVFDSVALRHNLKRQKDSIREMQGFLVDLVLAEIKASARAATRAAEIRSRIGKVAPQMP